MDDWIPDGYHKQITKGLRAHVYKRPNTDSWFWFVNSGFDTIGSTERTGEEPCVSAGDAMVKAEAFTHTLLEPL